MNSNILEFKKSKDYLVCVDSDGCAMDTMEVKHKKCFGPKAVELWGLQNIENKFLETWNMVNLYSKWRGINRFKGLLNTFELLKDEGLDIPDFSSISKWVQNSKELSNPSLEREIEITGDKDLVKVLSWSKAVNKAISELPKGDKPFPNVLKGLEAINFVADIAVVSSANLSAIETEWAHHQLISYAQLLLGQEAGSKAFCIQTLKEKNYSKEKVLMVGDAPGDLEAAMINGVLFYPILVGKEEFSWKRLVSEALPKFIEGTYSGVYQSALIDEFNSILK